MWEKGPGKANYIYFAAIVIILAAAISIRFYNLGERSLWVDEAWVANAIIQDSIPSIVKQSLTAPFFFTLSNHYIVNIFGKNEFFLRLLPCLFGIGTLLLFYLMIQKHAGKTATLLTLLMLSFSYNFVHYSKESKQYSGAMFFTILLVFMCEKVVNNDKIKDWIILILISILGVGFDHSLLFIVPAVFLVLLFSFPIQQHWKKIFTSGAVVFAFSVGFFLLHIRNQISNSIGNIQHDWIVYYPKINSYTAFTKWFVTSTQEIINYFSLPFFSISLFLIIIGLSLFYKKSQKRFLIYILLPYFLVIMASFLHRYPFGGSRLMLFYAPLLYLSFGKGLDFIFEKMRRGKLYVPFILTFIFIAIHPVSNFVKMVNHPLRLEETRPLLNKMLRQMNPDDKIYVYYGAKDAFKFYYQTKYHAMIDTRNIIWGKAHRDEKQKYSDDLEKLLKKNMRMWVVFSHYWEEERAHIVNYLKQKGILLKTISDTGTFAYLFKIQ